MREKHVLARHVRGRPRVRVCLSTHVRTHATQASPEFAAIYDPVGRKFVGVKVSEIDFSTRGARPTRPGERPPARWTARTVPLSISSPPMAASLVRTCQDAHKRAP